MSAIFSHKIDKREKDVKIDSPTIKFNNFIIKGRIKLLHDFIGEAMKRMGAVILIRSRTRVYVTTVNDRTRRIVLWSLTFRRSKPSLGLYD